MMYERKRHKRDSEDELDPARNTGRESRWRNRDVGNRLIS